MHVQSESEQDALSSPSGGDTASRGDTASGSEAVFSAQGRDLGKLPMQMLKTIVRSVPSLSGNLMDASWAARAASSLLRVPAGQIRRCIRRLGKQPPSTETTSKRPAPNGLAPTNDSLEVLVNIALGVIVDGLSYDRYVLHVARVARYNVNVGQKYHSVEFVKDVEYLAARRIEAMDAEDLETFLPGLGIRSSVAIIADGVSPGNNGKYARNGTVQVICIAFVSPHSHRLCTRFISAPETVGGHDGAALCDDVITALTNHPLRLRRRRLAQGVLALVSGDGAFCKGGPARTQQNGHGPSTGAAEQIWLKIYPQRQNLAALSDDAPLTALSGSATASSSTVHKPSLVCTDWDKWHRVNKLLEKAAKATPLFEELYDVGTLMDSLFGVNKGKNILRAAADAVGVDKKGLHMPGATRKYAALVGEPGNFLTNLKAYAASLHIRKDWRRAGHSNFNLRALEEAGRRATAVDLVAFALIIRDLVRKIVLPAASFSQTLQEPWLTMIAIEDWRSELAFLASADDFFLCEDSSKRSARVWGRNLPAFMQTYYAMASEETPHFDGLELQRTSPVSDLLCLGPHCQCSFPAGAVRPHSTEHAPAPIRFQYIQKDTVIAASVLRAEARKSRP